MTIDDLKAFGADTDDGLKRCMGNEAFYLKLIGKALEDKSFADLQDALGRNDLNAAFEAAHSLKGVLGNLALTPIYTPVYEMMELLRNRNDIDYQPYMDRALEKKAELEALI
ncbi:MAG: Hpt domain-containing protein [Clostridiales bacterium]|nr:Hpt domain-containing protein [Clostridiales bacterium]